MFSTEIKYLTHLKNVHKQSFSENRYVDCGSEPEFVLKDKFGVDMLKEFISHQKMQNKKVRSNKDYERFINRLDILDLMDLIGDIKHRTSDQERNLLPS